MSDKNKKYLKTTSCTNSSKNDYDDGNIPEIDLPQDCVSSVEPLPESSRPRKDGPGGE